MTKVRVSLACAVIAVLLAAAHADSAAAAAPPTTYDFETFPNNGTYKLHQEKVDWGTAWKICRDEGAYLTVINDDEEAFILKGIFARVTEVYSKYCLIGFHDLYVEGIYVSILDEDLQDTGYLQWAAGQPDNTFNEDCGSMTHGALFNDIGCGTNAVFICEKELP